MLKDMTAKQIVSCAADYIEKNGLLKGDYWTYDEESYPVPNGPCCTMGALRTCASTDRYPPNIWNRGSLEAALRAVEARLSGRTVPEWNDDPGRTQEEVVSTLREVANSMPDE